jgi:transcriptional regulator
MNKQKEILKLREKGLTQREIGEKIGMKRASVYYYLNREKCIEESTKRFKKLTLKQRREIYKKRYHYIKEYMKKRYKEDKKFREKERKRAREYYRKKKPEEACPLC